MVAVFGTITVVLFGCYFKKASTDIVLALCVWYTATTINRIMLVTLEIQVSSPTGEALLRNSTWEMISRSADSTVASITVLSFGVSLLTHRP